MNFNLLYGIDNAILNREINLIKEKHQASDNDTIYYNIDDIQGIIEEAQTIGLFSPVKIIIIDSTSYLSQKKEIKNINLLEDYFNNHNSNSYLIFISHSDTIDSRKKLVKLISSKGVIKKVEATDEYLVDYVRTYLNKETYQMNNTDISYFISRVGNNINNIKNELDKLILYKCEEKKINSNDIDLLTIENNDKTIYDLVNLMLKNENAKAIKLYKNLILNGMDPSQIIAVIASQVRLLFQVKRLSSSGKSNDEVAKILEFRSVYRVKYLLSDSYYYSESTLIKYLIKLADIDKKIKINNNDGNVLLELFIAGKEL